MDSQGQEKTNKAEIEIENVMDPEIDTPKKDLYPTFLKNQLDLSAGDITVTLVIANIGAILG
ncbi:419_t:CDS:2, partial [Acaulospora colombiana]